MFRLISVIIISLFFISLCSAGALLQEDDRDSALDVSSGEGIYAYDQNRPPETFFFPKDKARWDGEKVTLSEWYMLTEIQKKKFIDEYISAIQGAYKIDLETIGADYLKALNIFSEYSNENTMREPSTKFIDILLSGQDKISSNEQARSGS